MNATQQRNLGKASNIEIRARRKMIKATADYLKLMSESHKDAIRAINDRDVTGRAIFSGCENTRNLLQSVSNAGDDAFAVWLHKVEKQNAGLARLLCQGDALLAGEFDGNASDDETEDTDDFED
jgi:hypothetical protein